MLDSRRARGYTDKQDSDGGMYAMNANLSMAVAYDFYYFYFTYGEVEVIRVAQTI
jgi:hypothetical protein